MPSPKRIKDAVLKVLMWTVIIIVGIVVFIGKLAPSLRIWVDLGIGHFVLAAIFGALIVIISLWQRRRAARRQKGPLAKS
jgi:Zn-dependent protease with chaperone function